MAVPAARGFTADTMCGWGIPAQAREIAELETVARRSLTEVRQAVTSYRQPTLAAELAMLLCSYEMARRLEGTGVTVNALHPGFVATEMDFDRIYIPF